MRKTIVLMAAIFTILGMLCDASIADSFEAYGLYPAACVISDHSETTLKEARRLLKRSGARALHVFPPDIIFGRFPTRLDGSDLAALPVRIIRSPMELQPGDVDAVALRVVTDLFNEKAVLESMDYKQAVPMKDMVLTVPQEVIDASRRRGPRLGSPSEIRERNVQQNSEFMIGSVLINIIIPQCLGGSEEWTDDEISGVIRDIGLGLGHYQNKANWVDLDYIYNYKDYIRVPVSIEPIEGDWNTDWIWMGEALDYLGYEKWMWEAHSLNNDMRNKFGTDWVFTAFVVDASENGCWQGPEGFYVAYAYLGGPLILVPYPACGYGDGLGFGRVFIHEMSHIFWALDEYASAQVTCAECSGYLNVPNRNTLYMSCQETVPCIMQSGSLPSPLPICEYTMGQVGLADWNVNSIPDIYEIWPELVFLDIQGLETDTVFTTDFVVAARVTNDAVPNENPYQVPADRIDYAPWIVEGTYRVNNEPDVRLKPSDGVWDGSSESIGFFMSRLEPGLNTLTLRVENNVGLWAEVQKEILYVGIKYYSVSANVEEDYIDLGWKTAKEVFGAEFSVMREDFTVGGEEVEIATVEEPDEEGVSKRHYTYRDEDIVVGHEYYYRIIGEFDFEVKGRMTKLYFPSKVIYKTAMIPIESDFVSYLLPNPTAGRTTFTIDIPWSYEERTDRQSTLQQSGLQGLKTIMTPVDVSVFNVQGQRISTIYSRSRYGGLVTLTWDGMDYRGRKVTPGVYFIRIKAGDKAVVKKVVVIR